MGLSHTDMVSLRYLYGYWFRVVILGWPVSTVHIWNVSGTNLQRRIVLSSDSVSVNIVIGQLSYSESREHDPICKLAHIHILC